MGKPKLLLEVDGKAVVAHVVAAALDSALHRVILVTGPSPVDMVRSLGAWAANVRLRFATNPQPERGMSSSLRVGLEAIDSACGGVMIVLADQPRLTPKLVDHLIRVFCSDPEKIVVPTVSRRRTTPVVFPADLIPELMQASGDIGGRNVVNRYPHRVVECEVGPWYDDIDVDTPEDLERVKRTNSRNANDQE
jgi:molybdenum cofactor cytidylyltransferase